MNRVIDADPGKMLIDLSYRALESALRVIAIHGSHGLIGFLPAVMADTINGVIITIVIVHDFQPHRWQKKRVFG